MAMSVGPERPPAAAPPRMLTRTPHMDLDADAPVAPGTLIEVAVWTDQEAARDGEAVAPVRVSLPEGIDEIELRVRLVTTGHLRVVGPEVRALTLDWNHARSAATARFTVEVRSLEELRAQLAEGADGREAGIMALFDHAGRPSGSVARRITLDLPADVSTDRPSAADEPPEEAPAELEVDSAAMAADLQVTMVHIPGDPRDRFLCTVTSPHVDLGLEPEPWHAGEGRAVVDEALGRFIDADPKHRASELRGAGYGFFENAPTNFQAYFWHHHDHVPGFETISIVTTEDTLPWELMVPTRDDPGDDDPIYPLGVEYDIGRWTSPKVKAAPQRIPLGRGIVVAPRYRKLHLEWAEDEVKAVSEGFGATALTPASGDDLEQALYDGDPGLFHFVGHGYAEGAFQELALDNDERIGENVLRDWLKLSRYLRRGPTLVVLNACEVGRPEPRLMGSGGIPAVFIAERAAAVLAPIWSVKDSVAKDVADRFYAALRERPGVPIPRILREIRRLSYGRGDDVEDSYAAYCFYGDPHATAEISPAE